MFELTFILPVQLPLLAALTSSRHASAMIADNSTRAIARITKASHIGKISSRVVFTPQTKIKPKKTKTTAVATFEPRS